MARLNEPPASSDGLEMLRKKMLRQNRDLAKSNNFRALRIRELENECACMLSENLELRGRILELEKQVEDNEARRIADHAMAIRNKLESQLAEWGALLAGLGLEPPMKKHSPQARKSTAKRLTFSSSRPSPSQRRLRNVARDIEELGQISESKSYPRQSMNHEQILALRSEASLAESAESPELGPPPMSTFIDDEPVKVDSPCRVSPARDLGTSPKRKIEPPVTLPSPSSQPAIAEELSAPCPKKKSEPVAKPPADLRPQPSQPIAALSLKTGAKRKLALRDDVESSSTQRVTDENQPIRSMVDKHLIREKAGGKSSKELAHMRKESRAKQSGTGSTRRPLAAKSTNNDVSSPTKASRSAATDEVAAAKADLVKPKASNERSRYRPAADLPVKAEAIPIPDTRPPTVAVLAVPDAEPALLLPSSPEPARGDNSHRGDTPPPATMSTGRESSRPSRRNTTAVSYAEPNLRVKMRRPTKELFDAVAGEGKNARRSSKVEPVDKLKSEFDAGESWDKQITKDAQAAGSDEQSGTMPASLAKESIAPNPLPDFVVTDRRRRPSSMAPKAIETSDEVTSKADHSTLSADTSGSTDVDVYEFMSSSPQVDKGTDGTEKKRPGRRQTGSRRASATVDNGREPKDRGSSRRRSMMV
ncbi:hypothetical protein RJ55_01057 [Drechmeria coniospora]|nr:hypothetical protein RJ55_01057 [Drechmeria coniospora]